MTDFDKTIEQAKTTVMPFESWERLTGESALAFAAFCIFRDFGAGRTIRKAVELTEKDTTKQRKRCGVWGNWSTQYRWRERAADYDRYLEKLKQEELRKTIEIQGELHRAVTGKMLEVVQKKLDTMNPEDLTQGNVKDWTETAIRAEREAAGLVTAGGKAEQKQGELNFVNDFNGL